jgi:hypothetical protein
MPWRHRLLELVCAGGAVTSLTACPVFFVPCGNANPDPCICNRNPPDSPQCLAESDCEDKGGTWSLDVARLYGDAGTAIEGHCVINTESVDAAVDAPVDGPHAIPPD